MQPLRILRILRATKISACSALRQVFLLFHKLSLIISVSIRDHPWANTLTQMIDSHTDLANLTDSRIVNSRVSALRRVLPFRLYTTEVRKRSTRYLFKFRLNSVDRKINPCDLAEFF